MSVINQNNNSGVGSDVDPPYVNDDSNKKNHWGTIANLWFLSKPNLAGADSIIFGPL